MLSHVQLFATPWIAAHQASLSITKSQRLLKLMSIESVIPSKHLILCCPILLCLQTFPASRSFQMSKLFASCGQSTGVSASASVLQMNIQDWFPLGLTGWISLQSKGLSRKWKIFNLRSYISIFEWIGASVIDNYLCGSLYCADFSKQTQYFKIKHTKLCLECPFPSPITWYPKFYLNYFCITWWHIICILS